MSPAISLTGVCGHNSRKPGETGSVLFCYLYFYFNQSELRLCKAESAQDMQIGVGSGALEAWALCREAASCMQEKGVLERQAGEGILGEL